MYYKLFIDLVKQLLTQCSKFGISCQFNQSSSFNRGRYLINVAAINSLGKKSSYSTAGAHLWVSGTGGEFGYTGDMILPLQS